MAPPINEGVAGCWRCASAPARSLREDAPTADEFAEHTYRTERDRQRDGIARAVDLLADDPVRLQRTLRAGATVAADDIAARVATAASPTTPRVGDLENVTCEASRAEEARYGTIR